MNIEKLIKWLTEEKLRNRNTMCELSQEKLEAKQMLKAAKKAEDVDKVNNYECFLKEINAEMNEIAETQQRLIDLEIILKTTLKIKKNIADTNKPNWYIFFQNEKVIEEFTSTQKGVLYE